MSNHKLSERKKLTGLEIPTWYDAGFYSKIRTPEEWLFELCKREKFIRDPSIRLSSIKEQEKLFTKIIFDKQIEKFQNILEPTPPEPIKYLSVSDVFRIYHLLTNTDWYKNHPSRSAFESAISTITNNGTLSREEHIAFYEMFKTPWCAFFANHQEDTWCPNKEVGYLSGIPLSIDPGYSRKDISATLKKKLNGWVGKLQDIRLQFASWHESKILAVFDLKLWFAIMRIDYTNIALHKLIWPNGRISNSTGIEVNPYDDIDHSISLVNRAIDASVIRSLFILCDAIKFKHETTTN